MHLLYHECLRTYGDRLLMKHDKDWFIRNLEDVCRSNFDVVDETSPEFKELRSKMSEEALKAHLAKKEQILWRIGDPEDLFFSHWNQEVDGRYM